MIFRASLKNIRFICSIRKVSNVVGVTSKLKEVAKHILMWDFDSTTLEAVKKALKVVQYRYHLPEIQILESNNSKGNYHEYCFSRQSWQQAIVIVASTLGIDWDFVRLALYRGNFTLRISDKLGSNQPKIVSTLAGQSKADCTPEDLETFVQYEIWESK